MKPIEVRLTGRFRFSSKLEGDHEMMIYRGVHMQTNQRLIMKGEEHKVSKTKKNSLSLLQQGKIYQALQGGVGIPYMHWCGQEEDFNFLVLQELDSTLEDMLVRCGGKFSLKTALMIGIDMVSILQYYHFKNYIYSNINPRHIMLGRGENFGKLYIIDLRKSNRYRDTQFQEHVPEPMDKGGEMRLINMQFSSLNYQKGSIPTRRDDMESLLYFIIYLIKGELPWSSETKNLKKTEFQKCRYVAELKSSSAKTLIKDFHELQSLFNYTFEMKFDDKPQYAYYTSTFNSILEKMDLIDDRMFDWVLLDDEEPVGELHHKFDIYDREEDVLQTANNLLIPSKPEKASIRPNSKLPASQTVSKNKSDKECIIY